MQIYKKLYKKPMKNDKKPNFKIIFDPPVSEEEDKRILAEYVFLLAEWASKEQTA